MENTTTEIKNRVANSALITVNLEDYYPEGKRMVIDIKDWLVEGILLKEKEFRQHLKDHSWQLYDGAFVALTCSTDAIVPGWAYMLVTTHLQPFAKKVVVGSLNDLETILYAENLAQQDFTSLTGKPVIIKGCSNKPVPENAYILLTQHLQPMVKSLMYGEACSSVPLYKKK